VFTLLQQSRAALEQISGQQSIIPLYPQHIVYMHLSAGFSFKRAELRCSGGPYLHCLSLSFSLFLSLCYALSLSLSLYKHISLSLARKPRLSSSSSCALLLLLLLLLLLHTRGATIFRSPLLLTSLALARSASTATGNATVSSGCGGTCTVSESSDTCRSTPIYMYEYIYDHI
jgi:hypothetical protein